MAQYSVIPAGSVVIITKASTISSSFGYVTSNMLGMHCSLRYLIYLWVRVAYCLSHLAIRDKCSETSEKIVSSKHRAYISRRELLSPMEHGTTGLPAGTAGAPGNQLDFHNVSVGGFLTLVNWVYVAGPSEWRRIKDSLFL